MPRTDYKNKERYKKLWDEKTRPVEVRTLQDIKLALQPFLQRGGDTVSLSCELQWQDGNKTEKAQVTGKSSSASHGDLLIEGMTVVKKRMDALGKLKDAVDNAEVDERINMQPWDVDKLTFGIDTVIKRRLGGKRVGCRIRWTVREGTFEYDPFSNKLYEVTLFDEQVDDA